GDVGASHSWRAGLSYVDARANGRDTTQFDAAGNLVQTSFAGKSRLAVADFIWKYAPNGNAMDTNFKVQAEYFWRRERGDLTFDADGALGLTQAAPYASVQGGGYLQGVWQFMPMWRVGARYDRLNPGNPDYGAKVRSSRRPDSIRSATRSWSTGRRPNSAVSGCNTRATTCVPT